MYVYLTNKKKGSVAMGVGNDCRPEDNNAENLPKGVN